MAGTELRAPRRRVRREKDHFLPILIIAVTLLGGGLFFARREADRREAAEKIAAEAAAIDMERLRQGDAEIRRRIRESIDASRSGAAPSGPAPGIVTTESGKTYYVPSRAQAPAEVEISAAEHYRRAIETMRESRQVQRQIDGQTYGGQGAYSASAEIGTSVHDRTCASLRDRKEALDERMRRYAYGNAEAEYLHEEWRQINRAMVQAGCR